MATFGIYDTIDHVWMGDDNGPKLFDDDDPLYARLTSDEPSDVSARTEDDQIIIEYVGTQVNTQLHPAFMMARIAAEMVDIQLRHGPHRHIAKEYDGSGNRKKDEVTPHMSTADALKRKLRGTVP